MSAFTVIILEKVVELFYRGHVRVLPTHKGQLYKALDFLEVGSIQKPEIRVPQPRQINQTVNDDQVKSVTTTSKWLKILD